MYKVCKNFIVIDSRLIITLSKHKKIGREISKLYYRFPILKALSIFPVGINRIFLLIFLPILYTLMYEVCEKIN